MKVPFFTIIIPTYNRAHTLRVPIDSILAQTCEDWELIIIDDGSTDGSRELVASYLDVRIRYIWQENQKESAARNQGIRLARGEWVCFQDSDDEYLLHHLETLQKAIKDHPNHKILKSGLIIYENGHEIAKSSTSSTSRYDSFPFGGFTTATFHRSVLTKIQFDERFYMGEDLHFMLKVGRAFEIYVISEWTGINHYNPNNSGGIGSGYEAKLINQKACLDDILEWNKTTILPYIRRKRCYNPILLLYGSLRFDRKKVHKAIAENIKICFRFPIEYLKLVIRIIVIKTSRWLGWNRKEGLF